MTTGFNELPSAAILRRMERLYPTEISLGLDRVLRLLDALGKPHEALPQVIHIAGTNGKGSVLAYLKAMLEASGKGVHTFTSPHLVRFHERISLAGPNGAQHIAEPVLADLLERVEKANGDEPITFFEITTAAAFLAYAENPADYLVLETGLGGRLDATNVVDHPAMTVIMPISHDHGHYLGDTLAKIAFEKAGILKAGSPGVIARQEREALDAIEARAAEIGAPLIEHGRDWDVYEQHGRLIFQTGDELLDLPTPRLIGRHQIDNAGAAIAALRALPGTPGTDAAIAAGLQNASWPARLQRLGEGPLLAQVRQGSEILLDGGHNPAAGEVLAGTMADLEERLPRPLHLICGMMGNKDAAGFLAPFAGLAEWVITVPIPGRDAAHDPHALADVARAQGLNAATAGSVPEALEMSRGFHKGTVRVLICGSLYLAGDVLRLQDSAAAT